MGKTLMKRKPTVQTYQPRKASKLSTVIHICTPTNLRNDINTKASKLDVPTPTISVDSVCASVDHKSRNGVKVPAMHRRILQLKTDEEEFVKKEGLRLPTQKKLQHTKPTIKKLSAVPSVKKPAARTHKKTKPKSFQQKNKENSNPISKTLTSKSFTPKKVGNGSFTPKKSKTPNVWRLSSAKKNLSVSRSLHNLDIGAMPIFIDTSLQT